MLRRLLLDLRWGSRFHNLFGGVFGDDFGLAVLTVGVRLVGRFAARLASSPASAARDPPARRAPRDARLRVFDSGLLALRLLAAALRAALRRGLRRAFRRRLLRRRLRRALLRRAL